MKNPKFINLTVFIIFFGTSLFTSIQKQNWIEVALYSALGLLFLWADSQRRS